MSAIKKCVLVGLFFGMTLLPAHGQSVTTADQIRSRVTPTLALFQKMGDKWSAPCASCHHQGLVMLALAEARTHGVPLNEKSAH
ncbi:MAG: hypothetical protein JWP08_2585, partial [Bryobacterales bacterium]|nr:hypothetical protein [Bryobacterales bacterium]